VPEEDPDVPPKNSGAAGAQASVTSNDSPGISLSGLRLLIASESFDDYLMYQPDGGIWVPLMKVSWRWGGTVEGDGNHFTPVGDLDSPPFTQAVIANSEPEWTSFIPEPPQWQQIPWI
jgi:hypothetical protein